MNLDESSEQLAARTDLAAAMQELGHALVGHHLDLATATELAETARKYTATVQQGQPRDRATEMMTSPRAAAALGGRRALIEDGEEIDLFRDSIVSGRTNPMGINVHVVRRGDAAVAVTALGPAFEGAPGRAHGGIVGAILDETMGHVLPLIGEMAYTANLTIDYIGPAPLGVEVTFTARLRDRAGRKLWIEAVGESADGVFVRAEALFLAVDLTRFTSSDRPASPRQTP
ncbi:PaaI family thioesterase [Iamia majanohamensis]|uniref:Acyl-coenzyme A thioesterase THEM4 n=1 Tax=Iamia majanohamensis TaxID=467976 RepID=A0AAE9Y459_9ACTN|nr:PaaI family thioesterase [Iamia majanohamensis]WCO66275.1 PaaI family thioesterase [Iamia majanohamensis]